MITWKHIFIPHQIYVRCSCIVERVAACILDLTQGEVTEWNLSTLNAQISVASGRHGMTCCSQPCLVSCIICQKARRPRLGVRAHVLVRARARARARACVCVCVCVCVCARARARATVCSGGNVSEAAPFPSPRGQDSTAGFARRIPTSPVPFLRLQHHQRQNILPTFLPPQPARRLSRQARHHDTCVGSRVPAPII